MLKKIAIIIGLIFIFSLLFISGFNKTKSKAERVSWWEFQSIDTMKYSRDIAREKLNDSEFDSIINQQVRSIAETGATHVAIATPYDEEFYPYLARWVAAARKYGLNVWFRGNWSGWEEWFGYRRIDRAEHIRKTEKFILEHASIFENGDVFSACPECENGGPGDPRHNSDAVGHREFLIDEYRVTKDAFNKIGKNVASNYASMNGDVAKLIMDRPTTRALDRIVTIDHYVEDPEQLSKDIAVIAQISGGKIVLGEFGAPILDIHGSMSEEEQAEWLKEALERLIETDTLVGINYWTNTGSSTELWSGDGKPRAAAEILKSFYKAEIIKGRVVDEAGWGIEGAYITVGDKRYFVDKNGNFEFPYFEHQEKIRIDAPGFYGQDQAIDSERVLSIALKKENEDIWFKIRQLIHNLLGLPR